MVIRIALALGLCFLVGCGAAPPVAGRPTPSVAPSATPPALVDLRAGAATVLVPDDLAPAITTAWLERIQAAAAILAKTDLGPLDDDWDGRLTVELPQTTTAFEALTGTGPDAAAAVTRCLPGGDRITINPVVAAQHSEYLATLVLHEGVHVVTGSSCAASAPQWVVEGLAEWVASEHSADALATNRAWVKQQVERYGVPVALPPDASFRADPDAISAAYGQARLAVAEAVAVLGRPAAMRYFRDAYADIADAATTATITRRYLAALQSVSASGSR